MHYGDKYHVINGRLGVVIYKHGYVDGHVYEVTSIQDCTLIQPSLLSQVLSDEFDWSSILGERDEEKWYLVSFEHDLSVLMVVDVTNGSPHFRLH